MSRDNVGEEDVYASDDAMSIGSDLESGEESDLDDDGVEEQGNLNEIILAARELVRLHNVVDNRPRLNGVNDNNEGLDLDFAGEEVVGEEEVFENPNNNVEVQNLVQLMNRERQRNQRN